jgi:hypothetical protein
MALADCNGEHNATPKLPKKMDPFEFETLPSASSFFIWQYICHSLFFGWSVPVDQYQPPLVDLLNSIDCFYSTRRAFGEQDGILAQNGLHLALTARLSPEYLEWSRNLGGNPGDEVSSKFLLELAKKRPDVRNDWWGDILQQSFIGPGTLAFVLLI